MKATSHGKHILVVDDETNVTMILAEGLAKLGNEYVIETANSGAEALQKAAEQLYNLVITDYKMPGMSGVELAQKLRRISPETQVVLMTAYGTSGLKEVVGSMELAAYLDKPVRLEQIRELIRQVVSKTQEGEDPFRSGERKLDRSIQAPIETLRLNTNARCVMLLSAGGHPIELAGQNGGLDIASIGALVAANFLAASELARLLGNSSVFKSSYHEGPDYDIYAHDINGDCLLAVIFGSESKTGIVRFYTNVAVTELVPLLAEQNGGSRAIDEGLAQAVDLSLSKLLG